MHELIHALTNSRRSQQAVILEEDDTRCPVFACILFTTILRFVGHFTKMQKSSLSVCFHSGKANKFRAVSALVCKRDVFPVKFCSVNCQLRRCTRPKFQYTFLARYSTTSKTNQTAAGNKLKCLGVFRVLFLGHISEFFFAWRGAREIIEMSDLLIFTLQYMRF